MSPKGGAPVHLLREASRWANRCVCALWCVAHCFPWRWDWAFHGLPLLRLRRGSQVRLGARLVLNSRPGANILGNPQRVILTVLGDGASLQVGDDVGMSGCSITVARSVTIGNRVLIGSGVLIMDTDAHPLAAEGRRYALGAPSVPIVIEDDVFVGARSIILKGVHIGRGSVIGAGSVVTRDVPPLSIAAGNPARIVGTVPGRVGEEAKGGW